MKNSTSEPVHTTVIEPPRGWFTAVNVRELVGYRELLQVLIWRDVKVRYKQTALGAAWIVLQPVITMVVFSLLFGGLLKVPSSGVPYPIFAYAALLPWNFFASSLNRSSTSLVGSTHLITKVYFPRLIIPMSGVLSNLVDFGISLVVLIILMLYYHMPFMPSVLLLPLFLLLDIITSLGFGLWFAALNVKYRDVNYLIPFVLQIWMYLTPVIYATSMLPKSLQFLLQLNPMTAVVEGFRWCLLHTQMTEAPTINPLSMALGAGVALVVLFTGLAYFQKTERFFADII
jgi:lipopolysaccharide transport system permease protein